MSRWSIREELRESLREHPWIWKAPFLAVNIAIWVGVIVLFVGPLAGCIELS